MKKKEYIGLAIDNDKIYAAHLVKGKHALVLEGVETIELPEPFDKKPKPKLGDAAAKSGSDEEVIFGIDDEESDDFESLDLDDDDIEASDAPGSYGQTKVGYDQSLDDQSNEQVLSNYFSYFGKTKLFAGINVAMGKSSFQPLKDVQPQKMKKKEQAAYFREMLAPIYNEDVNDDQYAWEVDESGNGWLVSYDNDTTLLNLTELAAMTYPGKVSVREMLPDEVIWAGLVRSHYTLPDDEITALVSIGEKTSRLVFLQGDRLVHVLPVINEGSKSKSVLQTIFSKLLFEIDKGTLPTLDQIIVMHSSKPGREVIEFFRDQFIDVAVVLFQPDPGKIEMPDELRNNPEALRPYITAIGAAQSAAGLDAREWPSLSLLPQYVREQQKIFKLEWHGMVLLAMIAAAPMVLNLWYQDYQAQRAGLMQEVERIDNRIMELRPVALDVERMLEEEAAVREVNQRIINLSKTNLLWSETLNEINLGMQQVPNTWFSSLRVAGEELSIEAHSIYRHRVPLAAQVFRDARVVQVNEGEVRGTKVLNFTMRVPNFRADETRFSPEVPEPDEELIREIQIRQIAR